MTAAEATLTFFGGSLVAPVTLLAQATGFPMPDFMQVGGGVVSLGFVAWYAYYVTTKVIPDLVANFNREIQTERQFFAEQAAVYRDEHRTALREMSDSVKDSFKQLADRMAK